MWKRNAIFVVCKHLCDNGVNPEEIAQLFGWRRSRVWYSVEGTLDAEQFLEMAHKKAEASGPTFDSSRWFCREEELIHANGKTYAFSNQWGGSKWYKAMDLLKEHFPQYEIDYTQTDLC